MGIPPTGQSLYWNRTKGDKTDWRLVPAGDEDLFALTIYHIKVGKWQSDLCHIAGFVQDCSNSIVLGISYGITAVLH